jgi:hypothetical protein
VAPLWDWDLAGSMEKVPVGRKSQGSRLKSNRTFLTTLSSCWASSRRATRVCLGHTTHYVLSPDPVAGKSSPSVRCALAL